MSLTGFGEGNTFNHSKISSKKVISDTPGNAQSMVKWGNNSKTNIGLGSKTKGAMNPTSMNGSKSMTPSRKGGASGDGPTPGFTGSGSGIAELNGAQCGY